MTKAPDPSTPISAFGRPVGRFPTRNIRPDEVEKMHMIEERVKYAMQEIPNGRAKSLALTKWDECRMWMFEAFRQDVDDD